MSASWLVDDGYQTGETASGIAPGVSSLFA